MPLAESDIELRKSNSHPSNDVDPAGGGSSSTAITNATVGEWFTRLRAKLTGTIDNGPDLSVEYQKVFLKNLSGIDSLLDAKVYLLNGLDLPASSGLIRFTSDSPSDDNTKKIVTFGQNIANNGDFDTVILNGVNEVAGSVSFIRAFRCKLVNVSNDALVAAAGNISITIDDNYIGMIPAGYSFATRELKLWVVSTTGESGESDNRLTPPSGSTFAWANKLSSALSIRNNPNDDTLGPNEEQGIWGELTLQPGSEAFNGVQLVLVAYGDGT